MSDRGSIEWDRRTARMLKLRDCRDGPFVPSRRPPTLIRPSDLLGANYERTEPMSYENMRNQLEPTAAVGLAELEDLISHLETQVVEESQAVGGLVVRLGLPPESGPERGSESTGQVAPTRHLDRISGLSERVRCLIDIVRGTAGTARYIGERIG